MFVLIISANELLVQKLHAALTGAGHIVSVQPFPVALHEHEPRHDYNVVIFDAGANESAGVEHIQEWRHNRRQTPLCALTNRADSAARTRLLRAGADDCLTTPFANDELLARCNALTRRQAYAVYSDGYDAAGFIVDPESRSVSRNNQTVGLTEKEFRIFEYLIHRPGRTLTRAMIGEHVWGLDYQPQSNTIDVYISYLRRKLGRLGPVPIATVRDAGYAFRPA